MAASPRAAARLLADHCFRAARLACLGPRGVRAGAPGPRPVRIGAGQRQRLPGPGGRRQRRLSQPHQHTAARRPRCHPPRAVRRADARPRGAAEPGRNSEPRTLPIARTFTACCVLARIRTRRPDLRCRVMPMPLTARACRVGTRPFPYLRGSFGTARRVAIWSRTYSQVVLCCSLQSLSPFSAPPLSLSRWGCMYAASRSLASMRWSPRWWPLSGRSFSRVWQETGDRPLFMEQVAGPRVFVSLSGGCAGQGCGYRSRPPRWPRARCRPRRRTSGSGAA
ncbi:MAG: hypothetical protein QOG07_1513 [Pseudonocardiales bacterium]|nr:hypothetical protein [Pseudonocardiales bacterium]